MIAKNLLNKPLKAKTMSIKSQGTWKNSSSQLMSTFVETRNMMSYYTNIEVRKQIDEILRLNAIMFANLGTDCNKGEIEKAKVQERRNLREIKHLDPQFVDMLLQACD